MCCCMQVIMKVKCVAYFLLAVGLLFIGIGVCLQLVIVKQVRFCNRHTLGSLLDLDPAVIPSVDA